MDRDNLTAKQSDYAVFLPAISSFYSGWIGKQRHDPNNVPASRIPTNFEHGVEGLNWLNADQGYFQYKWSLYSAGHANIDMTKDVPTEDMIRVRDRNNSWILGDSGGFQIAKGIWEADWKDPSCPKAQKKREQVLTWMDSCMDYGMILDIPVWSTSDPKVRAATGVSNYQEAIYGTDINNQYFMQNRNGNCKFLNVLQGGHEIEANDWYERMKHYCDPRQHEQPFEGWSMGGQHKSDIHLALQRIVALRFDGLLEKGQQDWMHFLGTSKLEWAVLLTDIQRAVRKYHNENFTISFDCASPFLASANGAIYSHCETPSEGKWTYKTVKAVDNKRYANDTRPFGDAVRLDNLLPDFVDSPIAKRLQMNDVCYYKDGVRKTNAELNGEKFDFKNLEHYNVLPDLNKIGKIGATSWDSFSYCMQMGHNVWCHLHSVQEANRQYDNGNRPAMMAVGTANRKVRKQYDYEYFRDIVDAIFATDNRDKANELIEHHKKYWMDVVGTGAITGKNTLNPKAQYNSLFDVDETSTETAEDYLSDEANLDILEQENE